MSNSQPTGKKLTQLYLSGLSQRDLAEYFGVSRHQIRKWFEELKISPERNARHNKGGAPKGSGRKVLYSKEELLQLYNKPMSMRDIATHFNTTEAKVRRDFKNWNLIPRNCARPKSLSDEVLLENLKASRKRWVENNKEKKLSYTKNYKQKRLREDLDYRLLHNLRSRAFNALKSSTNRKSKLVGCTGPELRKHLESLFKQGMTWENYGYEGWHIDHIKPCSSFDLTDPKEVAICFHYSNLQPLWADENFKKSNRILENESI